MSAKPLEPPVSLLAKLGSLVVHLDEGSGSDGHAFDWFVIGQLIADPEVRDWVAAMDHQTAPQTHS